MAYFVEQKSRREPFLRAPLGLIGLIALIVAAHLARAFAPQNVSDDILLRLAFIPARYSSAWLAAHHLATPSLLARAIPFVGYMFVHAGFAHLAVNCLWLLAFGSTVARRYGTALFLVFFVLCGVAGALLHLAFFWGSEAAVIGASGAVSGVMAAGIRMLRPNEFSERAEPAPLLPLLSRQVLLFSVLWIGVNILAGVTGIGAGPGVELIAWQVHLGGYFAGLFLSGPFDALRRRTGTAPAPAS